MANCQIETGFQLITRLSSRPTIENIYPDLFPNGGPFQQQVIEIIGSSSTGKTFLITEIVARCLLPKNINNIAVGGKNSGAIVINSDHHFNLLKLIKIMENMLKKCKSNTFTLSSQHITDIIKDSLENLFVLNCFDSQQLYITFHNLENILSTNHKVSCIVLDSISAYYWSDRLNGGIRKMDTYQKLILRLLQNVIKDYKLVIMFTKPDYFSSKGEVFEGCCKKPTLERINYRIFLEKGLDNNKPFLAKVTMPANDSHTKYYKINNLIEWL